MKGGHESSDLSICPQKRGAREAECTAHPPTAGVTAATRKSGVKSRLPNPVLRKALFLVRDRTEAKW